MASRASPRLPVTETSLIDRLSRRRHRAAAAAALAGAAGSFALPPFGLVPLVAALSLPALQLGRATSSGEAGLIVGAAGFGWFLASLWWISLSLVTGNTGHWPLIPLPLFGIPLLLALFWVPAGASLLVVAFASVDISGMTVMTANSATTVEHFSRNW